MPIYEYVCDACGKVNDVLQKVNDPPPEKCEACGKPGTLHRVVSRTSFVLKGGGWYSDLYSSKKKDGGSSASTSESKPEKSAGSETKSGSETKPAPAPATTEGKK